jgi:hypothetical protein
MSMSRSNHTVATVRTDTDTRAQTDTDTTHLAEIYEEGAGGAVHAVVSVA